jgi:hypothetical protein
MAILKYERLNNSLDNFAKPHTAISNRSIEAHRGMVDLGPFYTESLVDNIHQHAGNSFACMPSGINAIGKVFYDVRGIVQLAGLCSRLMSGIVYPKEILGIPVGLKARKIYVLHATAWHIDMGPTPIGEYRINYQNDQTISIPLIYKQNIWDWWGHINEHNNPVWKGTNEQARSKGMHLRLYQMEFNNPLHDVTINTIDLISNGKGPGPMVIAITIDDIITKQHSIKVRRKTPFTQNTLYYKI